MSIYQGTQFQQVFLFRDENGDAIDISDWEFQAMFRDRVDTDVVLTLDSDDGFEVTDGADGELTMTITAAQTAELPKVKLVFDVIRTDDGGGNTEPVFMFAGKVLVRQPVTRDD